MKNVLLFATLFTLVFAGCKKNDKADSNNSNLIIGQWTIQKIDYLSLKNGEEDYSESEIYDPASHVEFKSDRTYSLHAKAAGDEEFENTTGTYLLSGKELTLVDDGNTEKFQVKTLDKNNLIFERVEEYVEEGDSYKDTDTFYLTK